MAQSANFNTPERIIRTALKNAGMLADGGEPDSEITADCMDRLNDLVNLWQTQGVKLWLFRTLTLPLIAGTATYVLGPSGTGVKEMRVLEAYYNLSTGVSRPLDILTWNTYGTLSNKTQQGPITSVLVDRQPLQTNVTFWLVPDSVAAQGTVSFLVQDPIPNLVALTDTMVFPNEWYIALHWGLADEICTGQPEAIVKRCAERARMYREALENWDVEEGPTSWAPNRDGQASAFR